MKILHVFTIISTPVAFFDGQFRYLSDQGYRIDVASDSEEDVGFTQRNNIGYWRVGIERRIAPLADLKSISALCKLIRREKYDVVVGHTPKGAMVAMIAARLSRVKTRVYYRHGLVYTTAHGLKRFILKSVERLTAMCASHVVNVSPSLSRLAVTDCLNPYQKQRVIGKGTCGGIDAKNTFHPDLISDEDLSTLRLSLGLDSADFVIGFCGRLCKEKGIRELVDGFSLFRQSNPSLHAKLLLVGPYDQRDILPDEYIREIETDPDIIATGRIEKARLPYYYALMDVFVFPSYREGFGMSVLEASAMKVPVLVSRSHGCIDSIVEHVTGEYVDTTAQGISAGLEKMKDTDLRINLGVEGRERVLRHYDYRVMWPLVSDFYSELNNK